MAITLKEYLVRLASDPHCYSEFVADPVSALTNAGVCEAERSVFLSGDQSQIYTLLVGQSQVAAK